TRDELVARARLADYVLLGEKHDNPDHHRLQAEVIQALAREGPRPTVAFEMLSDDDRPKLELWQKTDPESAAAFADIVDWKHSGWPDFELYRPVFEAAISRRLPIEPANLSKSQLQALHGGLASMPEVRRRELGLDAPLSARARESLADEIRTGHCGMANDALVDAMVDVQRARDASLAAALIRAGVPAVLIAGAGHVRRDRGVPLYLARRAPERRVLVVAFMEVGREAPDRSELTGAFDLVWWTPRVDDLDPCTRFKEELEKLHS
ncbi:MAG TPA: ChaN family lipoprotein, partial [Myxococcota bacterium]|nr:ChaN family lipoprotein [Myxococcota bacterium]